jgi:acetyl-CoA acyltransferase 1
MAARIGQLASHLDPRTWSGKGLAAHSVKNDNDVVIVAMGRTPFCKARKGQLKDTP